MVHTCEAYDGFFTIRVMIHAPRIPLMEEILHHLVPWTTVFPYALNPRPKKLQGFNIILITIIAVTFLLSCNSWDSGNLGQ